MYYMSVCCPSSAGYQSDHPQSWRPRASTRCNNSENRLFLALGVQDRYPAVLSASLHRLGFISWLRWLGSKAKRPLIIHILIRSPLRWLPVRPPSLDVRECNLVELTSESGMSQALSILVLLRRDSLFVDVLSSVWPKEWHTGATPLFELSKMREVAFDALVQRTLHAPRILRNPVSGGESPGLSSTASPRVSSSGASRSARKRSSASSPSCQSGKMRKNHQDKCRFFISWRLRPLRSSKESAG